MHTSAHVEVRGQCAQAVSFLPLHGLQRWNSGCQVTIIHGAILLAQIILTYNDKESICEHKSQYCIYFVFLKIYFK